MRRSLVVALVFAIAGAGAVATARAAGQDLVLPAEWTAEEAGEVTGVELHYSPDLRCRVAIASTEAKQVSGDALWSALRGVAPAHGLVLESGDEPVGFERGEFVGSIRLRQVAAAPSTWQLQACFYRKRNQHVCKPICQKLLD